MLNSQRVGRILVGLFSACGALVASYLSYIHVQGTIGEKAGGSLCNVDGFINCDAAAQSSYATILGIPIALLGLAFYAAVLVIIVLSASKKDESKDKAWSAPALATTLFGVSLLYSAFLLIVSLGVLESLCPFCAMLYVLNLGGFVGAWVWYGKKPHHALIGQLRDFKGVLSERTPIVFGVVFFATLLAGLSVSSISVEKGQKEQARIEAQRSASGPVEESSYRAGHSPALGPIDAPVVIVEFSNFPCPHCGRLSGVLKELLKDFPDQVRVEFRHFPFAHQEEGNLAARAGVCANEVGKFWPLHDAMFENAPALSKPAILGYARGAGLDAQALSACMDSELSRRIVQTDVSAGQKLGIQGTPTFFLNGRRIEGVLPYPELTRLVRKHLR
ncbi:MAG: thioredoxin domain-containing protein [Bradymonadaceae bacterium]